MRRVEQFQKETAETLKLAAEKIIAVTEAHSELVGDVENIVTITMDNAHRIRELEKKMRRKEKSK